MLMANADKQIPAHRQCPHCKTGVGDCDGTSWISATLKRRGYKCRECLKRWTVDVREEIINLRRKFQ